MSLLRPTYVKASYLKGLGARRQQGAHQSGCPSARRHGRIERLLGRRHELPGACIRQPGIEVGRAVAVFPKHEMDQDRGGSLRAEFL